MSDLKFLSYDDLVQIRMEFATPSYVYDEKSLRAAAKQTLAFPHAFGFLPRYAMKAAPTAAILRIFNSEGLGIDASSVHEVESDTSWFWYGINFSKYQELPRIFAFGRRTVLKSIFAH